MLYKLMQYYVFGGGEVLERNSKCQKITLHGEVSPHSHVIYFISEDTLSQDHIIVDECRVHRFIPSTIAYEYHYVIKYS